MNKQLFDDMTEEQKTENVKRNIGFSENVLVTTTWISFDTAYKVLVRSELEYLNDIGYRVIQVERAMVERNGKKKAGLSIRAKRIDQ